MTVIYILLALVVLLFGLGYYFFRLVVYPRVWVVEETYKNEVEKGKINPAEWEALEKEQITIRSPHGYDLFAYYIPLKGAKKTVIITHGITYSLYGSVKYLWMFRKRGYNALLWDLRHHGRSGGPDATFGLTEPADLRAVTDYAEQRLGGAGLIGSHGESMGAAIALIHAAGDARIRFVLADCCYSSMRDILAYRLKDDYRLPPFPMLHLADIWFYQRYKTHFADVSPLKACAALETPVFFTHGAQDAFTPPTMSEALYAAKTRGLRKLYLSPGADHAEAYWNNQAEYDRLLGEFLKEVEGA